MDAATLRMAETELSEYLKSFADCFPYSPTRKHLGVYVRGQLGTLERKSTEPIALEARVAPRTLHQFVATHNWDEGAMRSRVRTVVATKHRDANAILVVDETCFAKKRSKTVGVKRQWCGDNGKVDNCVQTVHLTYVAQELATIVGSDIYLPEDWEEDEARRKEAGVPEDVEFRTKWLISLDLLDQAEGDGIKSRWVTADESHGRAS